MSFATSDSTSTWQGRDKRKRKLREGLGGGGEREGGDYSREAIIQGNTYLSLLIFFIPPLPNPLPFFPSSLSPIPYPFRRLLRRLQNPPIRWPIHLPPYGRFECKHSKKESQLGRGKPVWYILEKHVSAGLNVDFFNQEQIKQNGHGWNWT